MRRKPTSSNPMATPPHGNLLLCIQPCRATSSCRYAGTSSPASLTDGRSVAEGDGTCKLQMVERMRVKRPLMADGRGAPEAGRYWLCFPDTVDPRGPKGKGGIIAACSARKSPRRLGAAASIERGAKNRSGSTPPSDHREAPVDEARHGVAGPPGLRRDRLHPDGIGGPPHQGGQGDPEGLRPPGAGNRGARGTGPHGW